MKIQKIQVSNFRGIKSFTHYFGDSNFVCFAGRGDSTKSTILEAIDLCLSSKWSLPFIDSDFFNADINSDIDISITVSDFNQKLILENKYGLYIRLFDSITHEFVNEEKDSTIPTLTINLNVNSGLNPEWKVVGTNLDNQEIGYRDRALLGVFLVSDYADYQLAWSKGSPLYSLQLLSSGEQTDSKDVVLETVRLAKKSIEEKGFDSFDEVIKSLSESAVSIGANIADLKASVDIRDIAFRTNTVSLHHQNQIPLRLDGKGTKRLTSIAIQKLLVKSGGLMLVDELEQGLEPDRVKQLIRSIQTVDGGQTFVTTHSSEVIKEADAENIFVVLNSSGIIKCSNEKSEHFQKLYRSCPESVYADKVILCEGKTEVGAMRVLNEWRQNNGKSSLSSLASVIVDGSGDEMFERAKNLNILGKNILILCDSDVVSNDIKKEECKNLGIKIVDWDKGNDFEHQVFGDLPWEAVKELIKFGFDRFGQKQVEANIAQRVSGWNNNIDTLDNSNNRKILADISTIKLKRENGTIVDKSWFKTLYFGEFLGKVIFKEFGEIDENSRLKRNLSEINLWLENNERQ